MEGRGRVAKWGTIVPVSPPASVADPEVPVRIKGDIMCTHPLYLFSVAGHDVRHTQVGQNNGTDPQQL